MKTFLERVLRLGRTGSRETRLDILWLTAFALLLIGTGVGLRDPWPADEPRFVLIARDMVASGNWLIPQVGGDSYPDKPPLYFWLLAGALKAVPFPRIAFLLPSLLAGIGCVVLVYDLARRLWNREIGFAAGCALLMTIQFVWQARQAQIDATLCFWTTLGLYGLLRHLLLGPTWRWYSIGWAAAGFGVITKGVGFLPLLVLLPYAFVRGSEWQPRPQVEWGWRWALGPLALLAAVSVWLAPMLLASASNPELANYRDDILFHQTVDRYAQAWHHREPFWYFIVEVIPVMWLPLTALIPWLWPYWRDSLHRRDLRVLLPLAWALLVVVFFSLSSGKRGVYVLPAVPAAVLASAPFLSDALQRKGARRTLIAITTTVAIVVLLAAMYLALETERYRELIEMYGMPLIGPSLGIGIASGLVCLWTRARHAPLAYASFLVATLIVVSVWINPGMNDTRSGRRFVREVEAAASDVRELGLVAYKEQYLLHLTRPTVNFGHARWNEPLQEARDAAAWLAAGQERALLLPDELRSHCFKGSHVREVGTANRELWYLVKAPPDEDCVVQGNLAMAHKYQPPALQAKESANP